MSLFGMMWVGVSGMSAQATKLSTVGDNIANANTTGYKKTDTQFSTLVTPDSGVEYVAGGVQPQVRYNISEQGALTFTENATDLAVSGEGFFLVQDSAGSIAMTRAGSFRANGDGELVNAAGMRLLGYAGEGEGGVINGVAGLEPINISTLSMQAAPSRSGTFAVNFPADADVTAAGDLPSANAATAAPAAQTSMVVYDNLGREVILDVYATKVAPEEWEVSVFNQADAGAGGFPYAAGPLVTQNFQFDPANGQLTGASAVSVAVPVPGGELLTLDMSMSSQLAAGYSVFDINVDGNGAAAMRTIDIDDSGRLYAVYENGARVVGYRIPLGTVASPDRLIPQNGNTYLPGADSGDLLIGVANAGGLGGIVSSALEGSTVDIADELTAMIQAQRSYTANSKVFMTGSELLDVLVNLKR